MGRDRIIMVSLTTRTLPHKLYNCDAYGIVYRINLGDDVTIGDIDEDDDDTSDGVSQRHDDERTRLRLANALFSWISLMRNLRGTLGSIPLTFALFLHQKVLARV